MRQAMVAFFPKLAPSATSIRGQTELPKARHPRSADCDSRSSNEVSADSSQL